MTEVSVRLGAGGRLVIPAEMRSALGLEAGDTLMLALETDGIHVRTPAQAIAAAQALVRRYVPEGRSLSDELIAERRDDDAP